MHGRFPTRGDHKLIQIVDSALADATRRSGHWLVCRPDVPNAASAPSPSINSTRSACSGASPTWSKRDPKRAARIRAACSRRPLPAWHPTFPATPSPESCDEGEEADQQFAEFANDEPCPVLDPATGLCELYESRPMTCRVFGPPVRSEDGLGVCELCFQGASDKQIAACEMKPDPGRSRIAPARAIRGEHRQARQHDHRLLPRILNRTATQACFFSKLRPARV